MKLDTMSYMEFRRRDMARVSRNDDALRQAKITARDDGVPFVEADFTPPEPEPDTVLFAGANKVVLATREKGDPFWTAEQIADEVRMRVGDYKDSDPLAGSVRA